MKRMPGEECKVAGMRVRRWSCLEGVGGCVACVFGLWIGCWGGYILGWISPSLVRIRFFFWIVFRFIQSFNVYKYQLLPSQSNSSLHVLSPTTTSPSTLATPSELSCTIAFKQSCHHCIVSESSTTNSDPSSSPSRSPASPSHLPRESSESESDPHCNLPPPGCKESEL